MSLSMSLRSSSPKIARSGPGLDLCIGDGAQPVLVLFLSRGRRDLPPTKAGSVTAGLAVVALGVVVCVMVDDELIDD